MRLESFYHLKHKVIRKEISQISTYNIFCLYAEQFFRTIIPNVNRSVAINYLNSFSNIFHYRIQILAHLFHFERKTITHIHGCKHPDNLFIVVEYWQPTNPTPTHCVTSISQRFLFMRVNDISAADVYNRPFL